MADTKKVFTSVEILEVPYEVSVPVYKKEEKPEYVLVKEEVVIKVPKVEYENKTYERPVFTEKIVEVPVYKEVEIVKPIIKEKIIEVEKVVIKEKIKEVEVPKVTYHEDVRVVEIPVEIKIPKLVQKEVMVTNAVIEDKHVTNAILQHVNVDVIHPVYLCAECRKNKVDPTKRQPIEKDHEP